VSENDTGYKGVHLSFTIDGFRTEMQVSTREAWFVKQAGEEVYAKWRDFNLDAEINKILEAETSQEAETLREQLVDTLELKQVHNQACREIFEKLHQSSDFAKWKNAINAILAINDNYQNEQLPQEVIDKFSVKSDDSISREELFEKCREFSDLAKPAQEKLISIATNALETAKNMNHVNPNELLTYEEKTFILLKQEYMKILISQSNDKYGDRFIVNNHIRTINRMSNERSLATIEYCREKGIRINSYEVLNSVLKSVNNCDVEKITDLTIKGVENLHKRIEYDIVQNNKTKEISSKKIA
ncbi:MAG: hypothetical protein IJ978_04995, partial [Clostridia bacterium]|nr:hypothetical protein [Clostridia bacterium]